MITVISGPTRKYFLEKEYGSSIERIGVVFMCRDPKLTFKQRVRFSKRDKTLFADVMLDYQAMVTATNDEVRFNLMKEKLLTKLPAIIKNYKFPEFDNDEFTNNLQNILILIQTEWARKKAN